MGRILAGLVGLVMVVFSLGTCQQGIKDATQAATRLNYYPIRDMRKTVALIPNHTVTRGPDAESVPTGGKDVLYGLETIELATKLGTTLRNPIASDDSSLARGERKFIRTCVPCHGAGLAGDGPVAALFMPPPDLLAEATRQREDGYLYSYIRHGGAVMPSYGAQVTAEEAWHLVNYIRNLQKVSPR
ncbi:MAG: cytochrome c [Candidatus Eisenbacteria bacterium]